MHVSESFESDDITIDHVASSIFCLVRKINSPKNNCSPNDKAKMISIINQYFPFSNGEITNVKQDIVYFLGAFFNPNLKSLNFLQKIYTERQLKEKKAAILKVIKENIKEFAEQHGYQNQLSTPAETTFSQKLRHQIIPTRSKGTRLDEEINLYIKDTDEVDDKNTINSYWKYKQNRYPLLAKMARIILAIPASSACSERAFSKIKRIITDNRSQLTDENIEASMIVSCNPGLLTLEGSSWGGFAEE